MPSIILYYIKEWLKYNWGSNWKMMKYTLRLEVGTRTLPATVFRPFHFVAGGKYLGHWVGNLQKEIQDYFRVTSFWLNLMGLRLNLNLQSQRRSFPLYRRTQVAARQDTKQLHFSLKQEINLSYRLEITNDQEYERQLSLREESFTGLSTSNINFSFVS